MEPITNTKCTSFECTKDAVAFGELTFETWTKEVQYCAEHLVTAEIAAGRDGLTLTIERRVDDND